MNNETIAKLLYTAKISMSINLHITHPTEVMNLLIKLSKEIEFLQQDDALFIKRAIDTVEQKAKW